VRLFRCAAFTLGGMVSACAAVTGLNNYTAADNPSGLDGGTDDGSALGDATVGNETTAPPGDDAGPVTGEDGGPIGDGGSVRDAHGGGPTDSGGRPDAGVAAPCGPSNCSTCCIPGDGGGCAKPNANQACGSGGGACTDCTSSSKVCTGGTCVSTSCVATSCPKCTPYFLQCCKGTTAAAGCGCSLLFPPGPCT
jgi:hypothetical protein